MDSAVSKLTLANVGNTSNTLTIADVDNTSGTLSLADVDNTSDTLSLADVDNTSDTLSLANVDNTTDTLSLADVDNTSDTLTLARLDRENEGPWEFEYSYGGEADLHRHYDSCKKNTGHKNFIPVDKFSIEDLPEGYRDKDLVDYIRAVSDLTVRVSVKYVSDKRPATAPGSRKSYPGYKVRGRRRMTVGTGRVNIVSINDDPISGRPCKCKDCRNSSTPEINYAIIDINTAAHVVFDDLEGEHTTCHLFYDREGTPETCSGVVTLTGMSFAYSDVIEDKCYMKHYTHDLDLARRLHQTIDKMSARSRICSKMHNMCQFKQRRGVQDRQPLLFIVSHPHGCSKQVSLGRFTSADVFNDTIVSFLYNTATCPGSSGSQVHVLEKCSVPGLLGGSFPFHGVHCGVSYVDSEINYCRNNRGIQKPKLVYLDMLQRIKGPWEDNFCCVEEEDQNQHYAACKKNPGHGNFFPVEKFSMDNLPPFYRRDDVMRLLKLVSNLTVRVSVKYVSEKRPATVPDTEIPYPWFSNRGSNLTRVGSGWVIDVEIVDYDCKCKECRDSLKPKQQYAYIGIETAAHLVYDKLEAEHTTCHLFFDSGETPVSSKNVVTLTHVCTLSSDTAEDTCRIVYYTHNLDLVRSLEIMRAECNHTFHSLSRSDDFKSSRQVKQNGGEETTQEPPLHMVVSHPHGCAKQISIGCCGNPGNADTEESQCSHSSILCPGSSGAPLIDLSWYLFYPICD